MHVHGRELSVEDAPAVDLVGDDRQVVLAGHGGDLHQVLRGEVAAARIGRVVDDDGFGASINQTIHGLEVTFPRSLRLNI